LWRAVKDVLIEPEPADPNESAEDEDEDEDVAAERKRVADGNTDDDIIVLDSISKEYKAPWCGGGHTAVDRLSVGIEPGTCFGLLGVNGAGKTTTFKMLTGDELVSSGTALLDSFDIKTAMTRVRQRVGYAPQFDALIDLMTGRELLSMFARLRGVPEAHIAGQVSPLIEALGLGKYADKYSKTYSGGNKRKLSTGMALIGDPTIVLLDEPTSGMVGARTRACQGGCTTGIIAVAVLLSSPRNRAAQRTKPVLYLTHVPPSCILFRWFFCRIRARVDSCGICCSALLMPASVLC